MLRKAVLASGFLRGLCSICSLFAADVPQAGKVWRIGYIGNVPPAVNADSARNFEALQQALRERGYSCTSLGGFRGRDA